jgi:hypothetical protein
LVLILLNVVFNYDVKAQQQLPAPYFSLCWNPLYLSMPNPPGTNDCISSNIVCTTQTTLSAYVRTFWNASNYCGSPGNSYGQIEVFASNSINPLISIQFPYVSSDPLVSTICTKMGEVSTTWPSPAPWQGYEPNQFKVDLNIAGFPVGLYEVKYKEFWDSPGGTVMTEAINLLYFTITDEPTTPFLIIEEYYCYTDLVNESNGELCLIGGITSGVFIQDWELFFDGVLVGSATNNGPSIVIPPGHCFPVNPPAPTSNPIAVLFRVQGICDWGEVNYNIIIDDEIPVEDNTVYWCEGNSSPPVLVALPAGMDSYLWYDSDDLNTIIYDGGTNNTFTPQPPYLTNEYTVVVSKGSCMGTATIKLVVPNQNSQILGISENCAFDGYFTSTYTLTNPIPNEIYNWNITGTGALNILVSSNTQNATITWPNLNAGFIGATITVTLANFPSCVVATYVVNPCCFRSTPYVYSSPTDILYNVQGTQFASDVFLDPQGLPLPIVSNTGPYRLIKVNGTLIIDYDITFTGTIDFQMNEDSKILITQNANPIIDRGVVMRACSDDVMWKGIQVLGKFDNNGDYDPGSFTMSGEDLASGTPTTIQDAKIAIWCDYFVSSPDTGGGIFSIGDKSLLNKNHRNVLARGFYPSPVLIPSPSPILSSYPSTIEGARFDCIQTVWTSAGNNINIPFNPAGNASNYRSFSGVEYYDIADVRIGVPDLSLTNHFHNLDIGIYTKNSNTRIMNNHFSDFNHDPADNVSFPYPSGSYYPVVTSRGTAILQLSKSHNNPLAPLAYYTQIGDGSADAKNIINECMGGIDVAGNTFVDIQGNEINNIRYLSETTPSFFGVRVKNNDAKPNLGNHAIDNNSMYNIQDVFVELFNNRCTKSVSFNEMNSQNNAVVTPPNYYASGIIITEPVLGLNEPDDVSVLSNNIYNVKNGVIGSHLNKVNIRNNVIAMNVPNLNWNNLPSSISAGIQLTMSVKDNIVDNTIAAPPGHDPAWWTNGIWVTDNRLNDVSCNAIFRTGSGLRLEGYLTSHVYDPQNNDDNLIGANRMHRNNWGWWLNNGNTGYITSMPGNGQQDAMQNQWTGAYQGAVDDSWHTYYTFWNNIVPPECAGANSKIYVDPAGGVFNPVPFFSDYSFLHFPERLSPSNGNLLLSQEVYPPHCSNPNMEEPEFPFSGIVGTDDSLQNFLQPEQTSAWWIQFHDLINAFKLDSSLSQVEHNYRDSLLNSSLGQMLNELMLLSDSLSGDSTALLLGANVISGSASNNPQEVIIKDSYSAIVNYFQSCFEKEQVQLSASEISALELLATECPFVYGQGVLAARALLMANDGQKRLFVNSCELPYQSNAGNRMGGELDGFLWDGFDYWDTQENNEQNEMVSMHKAKREQATRIFPNPFNNQLIIETNGQNANEWFLWDITGRLLKHGKIQEGINQIDVSFLCAGSYFIEIADQIGESQKFQVIK